MGPRLRRQERSGSPPADLKKKKKEELFLSRVKLCRHNLCCCCRHGPDGTSCNFAHFLKELQLPEERLGHWSEVWDKGEVDMKFWPNYEPNAESLERFRQQFTWELRMNPQDIPNWAWGHAVGLKLLRQDQVPTRVPKDFEWPLLQKQFEDQRQLGLTTAFLVATPAAPGLIQRQDGLMQSWLQCLLQPGEENQDLGSPKPDPAAPTLLPTTRVAKVKKQDS